MAGIFVHVIDGLTPARLSTGAIRASGQPIEPRIQDPGLVRQSALGSGRMPGMVTTNIGDAIYLNLDGALDVWASLPISGKQLTCYYGDDAGVFPDDFEVEFVAYIDGAPRFSRDADGSHIATISLRDRSYLFAAAAVERGFLQTGDLEGTEVAGARRRQRVYGLPGYPEPILISPFEELNAYYLGHQEESGSLILYDGGVALAEGSPYATEADFLDTGDAPDPGEWRRWFDAAEGLFVRCGSKVYTGLRFAADFPEDSISDIAIAAGVSDAATMAAGSVDLDIGNRVVETQTAGAVLGDVARQHLSIIGFNRADEFMQRTIEPSTVASYVTSVVLVDGENVLSIDGVGPPQGFERRAWKVKVRSGATKAGQLAGIPDLSFGAAEAVVRDRWLAEFSGISQETKDDDSAEVMEIEVEANAFAGDSAAMLAYVEDVLALFGGIQLWFDIVVPYTDASIRALQLLDRVMIRAEGGRYMTGTGRYARVMSIERRLAGDTPTIRLALWAHYTEPDDVALIEVDDAYAATSYSSKALRDRTRRPEPYVVACSDLETDIEVGLLQSIPNWPADTLLSHIEGGLSAAQTGGSVLRLDIEVDGVSIFSTKPTFDNNDDTTLTASTPSVLSAYEIPKGSTVDIYADQVGTPGARGLKVNIVGFQ